MKKQLLKFLHFKIILPLLYFLIQFSAIRCGEDDLIKKCPNLIWSLYQFSYDTNPVTWFLKFFSTFERQINENLFLFFSLLIFIFLYIFGLYLWFLIGKLIDKILWINKI